MKLKAKKYLSLLIATLVVFAMVPLFSGCSDVPAETAALQFLDHIAKGRYDEAYALLTAPAVARIKQADFVDLYKTSFEKMQITSCKIDHVQTEVVDSQGHSTFTFDMVYTSTLAGEMRETHVLPLVNEKGEWCVDFSPSLIFTDMDWGDYITQRDLWPTRGEIFTADGSPLALNCVADTVFVNLSKIKDEDKDALCSSLASELGMNETTISETLQSPRALREKMAIIKSYMPGALDDAKKDKLLSIPGVGIDSSSLRKARKYPQGSMLAHTIGYVGKITAEELAAREGQGYDADSLIGKQGLEKQYEDVLHGSPGFEVGIFDDTGRLKHSLYKKDKKDGFDLHLTIDAGLQEYAEMALAAKLPKGQTGAVIAMNAETGDVRAIASYPTYDNNYFSLGVPKEIWDQLNDKNGDKPLFNRALTGLYPPGSTFKPFVAAKAMESGTINTNTVFSGTIKNNYYWTPEGTSWTKPIKRAHITPNPLNLHNALVWSDNIFFAWTAMQMGKDKMDELAKDMGLLDPFPFDLPVAKANYVNKDSDYDKRLLADTGYGQGNLLATPLQWATYACAFATGNVPKPLLVKSLYETDGLKYQVSQEFQPSLIHEGLWKSSTQNILKPILQDIVDEGTGSQISVPNKTIIGKTGTAEIGNDKSREIAWFVGVSMNTQEKLLVLVMVDVPEGQGNKKFEIANYVYSYSPPDDTGNTGATPAN